MIKLLVIADDLTGAIDAGVHFAERGIVTGVIPVFASELQMEKMDEPVEVLVINTESRHISAGEAAGRVASAGQFGLNHGVRFFYKKTDSTLRGNIGAELEALMNVVRQDYIPFIPAYPALKRFTREGYHYVEDKLLHQSRFSDDPLEPVMSSFIPDILKQQTSCEPVNLSYPFRIDPVLLESTSKKIFVFDCSNDTDLMRIGSLLEENDWFRIVAGSAGFASVLAKKLSFSSSDIETIRIKNPCLVVNGSLNPVSLEQIRMLEATSVKSFYLGSAVLNSAQNTNDEMDKLVLKVNAVLKNREDILINSFTSREDLTRYLSKKFGSTIPKEIYSNAAGRFGRLIAGILETNKIGMMVVIGGDTLMALIREIKIEFIHPITEILPGVVLSSVDIYDRPIHLVTKPGGYGEKDTLLRIIQSIKN